MAFNYRSPVESVLSKFSSEDQSKVTAFALSDIVKKEKFCSSHFNFFLSDVAKLRFTARGIYLSPVSYMPHAHAACKTLENHFIYNILPNYLDNSFFIASMKEKKIAYLRNRSGCSTLKALERFVTSKDPARYGFDNFFEQAKVKLDYSTGCKGATLKDMVPQALRVKARRIFLHDELHFWTFEDIDKFLCAVKPEVLLGTHIFPKELLVGANPCCKWLYDFELHGNTLLFFPDGHREGGYEQPVSSGNLLFVNKFTCSDGAIYSVSVLESCFSHSLIQFVRADLLPETTRKFSGFDASIGPQITAFGGSVNEFFPIRPEFIRKIYLYLRTLKKPDIESGLAKLRQSIEDASGYEIIFFESFSKLVLDYGSEHNKIKEDISSYLFRNIISIFPDFLKRQFESFCCNNLSEFIENLKDAEVHVDCVHINMCDNTEVKDFLLGIIPNSVRKGFRISLENLKEQVNVSLPSSFFHFPSSRTPAPYSGLGIGCVDCFSFDLNKNRVLKHKMANFFIYQLNPVCFPLLRKEARLMLFTNKLKKGDPWDLPSFSRGCQIFGLKNFLLEILTFPAFFPNNFCTSKGNNCEILRICNFCWHDYELKREEEFLASPFNKKKGIWGNIVADAVALAKSRKNFNFSNGGDSVDDSSQRGTENEKKNSNSCADSKVNSKKNNVCDFDLDAAAACFFEESLDDLFCDAPQSPLAAMTLLQDNSCESNPVEASATEPNDGKDEPDFFRIKFSSVEKISKDFKINDSEKFNKFGVPGDGDCFWSSITYFIGGRVDEVKETCRAHISTLTDLNSNDFNKLQEQLGEKIFAEDESLFAVCSTFKISITLFDLVEKKVRLFSPLNKKENGVFLLYGNEHFDILVPKEGCVIRAISEALNRSPIEIFKILSREENKRILAELNLGFGLPYSMLEDVFRIFGIKAFVQFLDDEVVFNVKGKIAKHFLLKDGHLELTDYSPRPIGPKPLISVQSDKKAVLASISGGQKFRKDIDISRATKLQKSFIDGDSGKILSELFGRQKEWFKTVPENLEFTFWPVVGTFGSGKSYMIKKIVQDRRDINFLIISPRRQLAEAFSRDLNIKKKWREGEKQNVEVLTFEVALKKRVQRKNPIVIFDELQLFPPGYIDLFMCFNDSIRDIVCLGDPAQSSYDNQKDRHIFLGDNNDLVEILSNLCYEYVIKSRRFRNSFFLGRLPCEFDNIENFTETNYTFYESVKGNIAVLKKMDAILCSSFDERNVLRYILGESDKVLTFGESTGLTFKRGAIQITQNVRVTDEKRILVALSRFSEEISLINMTGENLSDFIKSMPHSLLFKFCSKQTKLDDLRNMLPGTPTFIRERKVGSDDVDRELRLSGDPWLKPYIFIGQRPYVEKIACPEINLNEKRVSTHLPFVSRNHTRAINSDKLRLREARECRIGDLVSEQFRDEYFVNDRKRLSNQCDLFEAIYPRHKATDTVTFLMAVKKRLSFADPNVNASKFKAAKVYGELMLEIFLKHVPLRRNRNPELLAEAVNDFEMKKLEKSVATIENHSGRSNRDWNIREAFVFMKSQLCTKFEKRFVDAKAGQTLACFSHIVLCRFAPWMRYLEKKVLEVLPDRYYIHSGKNFDQLKEWVLKSDFSGECTESDYEAFDASQDSTILAFEVSLMKFLEVPDDVIDDYIFIKNNLYSKLGLFSIMRFTGEAGTFLFNTLANMCFTFMRYDINGSECIAFAGDDMCANVRLRKTSKFEHILDRMKLKAKVEYKVESSFCGWTLGSFGIYKKPQLVLERFMIAIERNTLSECIDNYAIEVSYGYRLGDEMLEIMSEEEMEYQSMCIRIIVQNAHLIKSNALTFFNGLLKERK